MLLTLSVKKSSIRLTAIFNFDYCSCLLHFILNLSLAHRSALIAVKCSSGNKKIILGIYGDNVIKFSVSTNNFDSYTRSNKNTTIHFCSHPEVERWERKVFRVDDDIKKIISSISKDTLVYKAIRKYPGLRLMRQEPHQCIFSFVCASNTNMFMTRKMLMSLCKKFGYKIIFDGKEFYTFPSVSSLNKASINELQLCGVGYRAKAIKAVAKHIVSGSLDIDNLIRIKYHDAKEELLKIYGMSTK
ncbi:MAG: DNA glycosylase [Candidatus Nitrosopolaris sp.]